jgi:uncharacterized surface protein with fasciclin (FAS1) repeats
MKFSNVLPFVAAGSAFVLPSEQVFQELSIEQNHRGGNTLYEEAISTKDELLSSFKKHYDDVTETSKNVWNEVAEQSKNTLDAAFAKADGFSDKIKHTAFDAESWLESELQSFDLDDPHHGPPHDGPHDGPHHPPHDGPHHPPHHGPPKPPNSTVWELLSSSKYTTKFSKLISDYPELVKKLNSTKANYTVFAPTDKAFEKIPEHHHKPSKEFLEALLSYHVVEDFYPARRVLSTHTVPTLLIGDHLAGEPKPQRLSFNIGLRGLTVNFYARIIAINIFGTNGVIHGVDSIILPPPNVATIIDLLPSEFSTLELGLVKTGLFDKINTTDHKGGTFFAPSNFAFQKLGPRINAFLFSKYGQKYLKALLEYHLVPDNTLYSDAYYSADSKSQEGVPKGYFHVDLPTMLEDKSLSIDIARYGGFISIKINGFGRVSVQDGIAQDGVIQVVSDVLIPPKQVPGGPGSQWFGEELDVEDLMERLEPYVAKGDL